MACISYIEHLGTGTTDLIAACEQYGLQTSEFHQAEDFRTIIFRKAKVSDFDGKVIEYLQKSNRAEQKSNRVSLTVKQRKVLEFCDEMPRTAQEILEMVGVKYQTKTVYQYTTKMVMMGMLRPTTTASHDPNRKYITAHDERDDVY